MSTAENYLHDLGILIAENAREAKRLRDQSQHTDAYDYQLGYLMAYHEIVSIMQQQADIFDIARCKLGLADLEPEIDLI